mmetsp:Transcript_15889/g.30739  ORF Transcript_15889/g.30739 Transcript_15889/m.30739 type:complete len:405 (-) Transcript_15889:237-1451(-)
MGQNSSCMGCGPIRGSPLGGSSDGFDDGLDDRNGLECGVYEAARVRLCNLERRSDLNGARGVVESASENSSGELRFRVRVKGGSRVSVQARNLRFEEKICVGDTVQFRYGQECRRILLREDLASQEASDEPESLEGQHARVSQVSEDGYIIVSLAGPGQLFLRASLDQVKLVRKARGSAFKKQIMMPSTEEDIKIPTALSLGEDIDIDDLGLDYVEKQIMIEDEDAFEDAHVVPWSPGQMTKLHGLKRAYLNGARCVVVGRSKDRRHRLVVRICRQERGSKSSSGNGYELKDISVDEVHLCAQSATAPLLWDKGSLAMLQGLRSSTVSHLNGCYCLVQGRAASPDLMRIAVTVEDPLDDYRIRKLSVRADRLKWPFLKAMPPVADTVTPIETVFADNLGTLRDA